jgi:purine-binding chemotaxis protein CheW
MNDTGVRTHLEFLVFEVAGHHYGLPVADVREIVRAVTPVPVAGAPAVVEGVINLRGNIVPLFDPRQRFRLPTRPLEPTDHLIIAWTGGRLVALRVDRVLDLVLVPVGDLKDVQGVARIARLPGDLVPIRDLSILLLPAEEAVLEQVLPAREGGPP